MHWTEEFFDDYYLESSDKLTDSEQTIREVDFILDKTGVTEKGLILDLACGQGRHAIDSPRQIYILKKLE
jgi:D-alanine-D-alanine ligase